MSSMPKKRPTKKKKDLVLTKKQEERLYLTLEHAVYFFEDYFNINRHHTVFRFDKQAQKLLSQVTARKSTKQERKALTETAAFLKKWVLGSNVWDGQAHREAEKIVVADVELPIP